METVKPFSTKAKIKKVIYPTGQKGDVFMLVFFHENKELKKHGINANIFQDLSLNETFKEGNTVWLDYDEKLTPTIKRKLDEGTLVPRPSSCYNCDSLLQVNTAGAFKCPNYYCPATSRSYIYSMLKMAAPDVSLETTKKEFLDGYVYNDTVNFIDNPYEFMVCFKQIPEKNTAARQEQWLKHHKEKGNSFWHLECALQRFLQNTHFTTQCFYSVCNFPKITKEEMKALSNINPQEFINGNEREAFQKLPKRCRTLLETNVDFIMFLLEWFKIYGDKVWVKNNPSNTLFSR